MTLGPKQAGHSSSGQTLRRALGVAGATAFVVTNMVGTGIFTVPAVVRASTGNGLAALGVWAAGAALALCGALCYAELATRMPQAGGEYYYLTRTYGRLWGFLSGWISFFVGFSAAIGAAALGAVVYADELLTGWDARQPLIEGLGITQGAAAAAGLIILLSLFHASGVRPSGRLQTGIAALVVGFILVFIAAGLSTGAGDYSRIPAGTETTGLWFVALLQVNFAYSGWNAAAYLGGETVNPRRTLPRALIGGTVIVAVLYLLLNFLFLYALPLGDWNPDIAVGKLAAERLFGTSGATFVTAIITLMIIGSVSSMTAAGPRVYYAMSRDGMAPPIFGRLSARNGAPVVALIVQAIIASMLALTGAFGALLVYAGSALLLFAGLAVASVYVARRKSIDQHGEYFKVPGYPITPAIFIILVGVAWVEGLRESPEATGAALATIAFGALIYLIGRSRGWIPGNPEDR
ncbi:MAG: APC family permease [Acidobacteria bacterium]|nr:APC family permease [Acidobacteriota bacterium]MCW5967332.1 APC family permease [Blastocatellales bacterium]